MPKYSFAFGENGSYFSSTGLGWSSNVFLSPQGLPESICQKLYTEVQASNRFVSLGTNGEYFFARNNGRGNKMNWNNNRDTVKASAWLREAHKAKYTVQFSFGQGTTFVACTSRHRATWSADLSAAVKRQIKGFHPVLATLGVRDAYVLVDGAGTFKWNLKGRYDQLDQILNNSQLGIEMVVLNPHAEKQYFIIFKNGTWRTMLPTTYLEDVKEMMRKQDEFSTRALERNNQIAINAMQNIMTMNANAMANMTIW